MKKYAVIFHPDAETDISSAYKWGRRVWGDKQAKAWAQELQRVIKLRLTSQPLSCPLAPESDDLGIAVRQLIVQRYRVLLLSKKRRPRSSTSEAHMPLALIHAKRFTNSLSVSPVQLTNRRSACSVVSTPESIDESGVNLSVLNANNVEIRLAQKQCAYDIAVEVLIGK